jgi:predicted Zn finger-like uncharacterized protein
MSNIKIKCPTCLKKYFVKLEYAGKKVKCKNCSEHFTISAEIVLINEQSNDVQNLRQEQKKIKGDDQNKNKKLIRINQEVVDELKGKKLLNNSSNNELGELKYKNILKCCWYCNQTLLQGWIQCVYCRMIV